MADKKTATGNVGVGPSRRKWDAEEFTAKARERDREERERLQENEERMRTGKKPLARRREELPKATELMKAREAPLELDKNLNKTMMVENAGGAGGAGRKGPGFYCELCQRTCKDSVGYLDHINGRTREYLLARAGCSWWNPAPCTEILPKRRTAGIRRSIRKCCALRRAEPGEGEDLYRLWLFSPL